VQTYLNLLRHIREQGTLKGDRTGTGTQSVFGYQMRFNLAQGFPLLTTKKVHMHSIVHELLWFLSGDTNIRYLKENRVTIWDEWADEHGNLGPVYGAQWRSWPNPDGSSTDQIVQLLEQIKNNPDSRRMIVSAWNVSLVEKMDVFLGVPFNIASYALLTHMIAQVCSLQVGDFVHTLGDAHLYVNHFDQVEEQLQRSPGELPQLCLNPAVSDLFQFGYDDIVVTNYDPAPAIKAPVAV